MSLPSSESLFAASCALHLQKPLPFTFAHCSAQRLLGSAPSCSSLPLHLEAIIQTCSAKSLATAVFTALLGVSQSSRCFIVQRASKLQAPLLLSFALAKHGKYACEAKPLIVLAVTFTASGSIPRTSRHRKAYSMCMKSLARCKSLACKPCGLTAEVLMKAALANRRADQIYLKSADIRSLLCRLSTITVNFHSSSVKGAAFWPCQAL